MRRSLERTRETRSRRRGSTSSRRACPSRDLAAPHGRAEVRPQIAPNSFCVPLDPVGPCRIESCLRRARGAGRTKPPEEHYAEADGSSGRWTKAFPARRILFLRPGPRARPFSLSGTAEHALDSAVRPCAKGKLRNLRDVHF